MSQIPGVCYKTRYLPPPTMRLFSPFALTQLLLQPTQVLLKPDASVVAHLKLVYGAGQLRPRLKHVIEYSSKLPGVGSVLWHLSGQQKLERRPGISCLLVFCITMATSVESDGKTTAYRETLCGS
jgi:hypothetical protein